MTPEEQRIAIAEACPKLFRVMTESKDLCWVPPGFTCEQDVDPLSDLNAMHEALATLTHYSQVTRFAHELRMILRRDMTPHKWDGGDEDWWAAQFAMANPRQLAEAFLRTLNLWKD